jgi:hypothetical protein
MPKKVTTVRQTVTPYGLAEQRRVITIPDEAPLSPEQLKEAQEAEARKQFAAGAKTVTAKAERAREHAEAHSDAEPTDDVHKGKADAATKNLLVKEVALDPHTSAPVRTDAPEPEHNEPSVETPDAPLPRKKRGRKKKT